MLENIRFFVCYLSKLQTNINYFLKQQALDDKKILDNIWLLFSVTGIDDQGLWYLSLVLLSTYMCEHYMNSIL